MDKASQIVVLCEDEAQKISVWRFLKTGWKVNRRLLRVVPFPAGSGSRKQHVEKNIVAESIEFRRRSAKTKTMLIVVRDVDEEETEKVRRKLEGLIKPPREEEEAICFLLPKWHIETWLAYLDGEEVDESKKRQYKRKYQADKVDHKLIDSLAQKCRNREPLANPPDSLARACEEFEQLRRHL